MREPNGQRRPVQSEKRRSNHLSKPEEGKAANCARQSLHGRVVSYGNQSLPRGRRTSLAPHQLRHTRATELRKQFGLDVARAILGHTTPNTTEIYAEPRRPQASAVMGETVRPTFEGAFAMPSFIVKAPKLQQNAAVPLRNAAAGSAAPGCNFEFAALDDSDDPPAGDAGTYQPPARRIPAIGATIGRATTDSSRPGRMLLAAWSSLRALANPRLAFTLSRARYQGHRDWLGGNE